MFNIQVNESEVVVGNIATLCGWRQLFVNNI